MAIENGALVGGCACGHVRYKIDSMPLIVHGCHCLWCQRQSGASFAVNALIEADLVEVTQGEVIEILVESPSGAGQKISRCPKCKIAVWSNYLVFAGVLGEFVRFIKVGTLDNPDQLPPDVHIYTSTKQSWVILPTDTPAFREYYDTRETWSRESLERLSVMLAAAKADASQPVTTEGDNQ